jgi:hypothetical protein
MRARLLRTHPRRSGMRPEKASPTSSAPVSSYALRPPSSRSQKYLISLGLKSSVARRQRDDHPRFQGETNCLLRTRPGPSTIYSRRFAQNVHEDTVLECRVSQRSPGIIQAFCGLLPCMTASDFRSRPARQLALKYDQPEPA